MPKFNVDEQTQLSEPIEVVLDGRTFTVVKITTELMKQVDAIAHEKTRDMEAPIRQFSLLTGSNIEELRNIDIRKIGKALALITENISKGIEVKNPSGAEARF